MKKRTGKQILKSIETLMDRIAGHQERLLKPKRRKSKTKLRKKN